MKTAHKSAYYLNYAAESLKSKKLKQPFRNHLLGIKMEEKQMLDAFYSLHLYPAGNSYQADVAIAYQAELVDDKKDRFIALTYEAFIEKAKAVGIKGKWLNYFVDRY